MRGTLSGLIRLALNIWLHGLTPPGRCMLVALFLATSAGSIALEIPIYHLFCGLMALLGVSLLAALLIRRPLRIVGGAPERVTAGQPFRAEFVVENLSGKPVYDAGVGFFFLPSYIQQVGAGEMTPYVPPGGRARMGIGLVARRRGVHALPNVSVFSVFPFNLWRKTVASRRAGTLLALPDYRPLDEAEMLVGRRYQPGGVALSSSVGESPEYFGNREYRPGDAVGRMDFRSWARLARPVVKEYQEEYYCRIALALDTYVAPKRRPKAEGFPDLEAAISLAASLADAYSRGDYLLDLFAAGPDLFVFRTGRSISHLDNILEILACVEECRRSPFEKIAPALAEELGGISGVIYVLLDWDEARRRFVRQGVESGAAARVFVVREGKPTEPWDEDEAWAGPVTALTPAQVRSEKGAQP